MKQTIILVAIGVLAVIGSVLGTLFLTGNLPGQGSPTSVAEDGAEANEAVAANPNERIYVSLDPAFVATFHGSPTAQFVQFDLEVAVTGKHVEEALKTHAAAIRNGLVMLLSSQDPDALLTQEGKEHLRVRIRDEIRAMLEELIAEPGVIDAYFTSFLMQ